MVWGTNVNRRQDTKHQDEGETFHLVSMYTITAIHVHTVAGGQVSADILTRVQSLVYLRGKAPS